MLFSRQEYFSGLSIHSAVDHVLSENFAIPVIFGWPCTAWLIDSFLELHKPFYSNKVLIHEVYYNYIYSNIHIYVCVYIYNIYKAITLLYIRNLFRIVTNYILQFKKLYRIYEYLMIEKYTQICKSN